MTLTSLPIKIKSGSDSTGNEEVLQIQLFSRNVAPPSDTLYCHPPGLTKTYFRSVYISWLYLSH